MLQVRLPSTELASRAKAKRTVRPRRSLPPSRRRHLVQLHPVPKWMAKRKMERIRRSMQTKRLVGPKDFNEEALRLLLLRHVIVCQHHNSASTLGYRFPIQTAHWEMMISMETIWTLTMMTMKAAMDFLKVSFSLFYMLAFCYKFPMLFPKYVYCRTKQFLILFKLNRKLYLRLERVKNRRSMPPCTEFN